MNVQQQMVLLIYTDPQTEQTGDTQVISFKVIKKGEGMA